MRPAPLSVQAIAWTHFEQPPGLLPPGQPPWTTDADGGQALAEFGGRACYQSWTKPNPATATNAGYLAHILEVGHLSVLEHGTVTFYLTGVSRSFTHELIRHRHLSYSQLSQRYVADDGQVVEPDAIADDPYLHRVFTDATNTAANAYRELVHALERKLAAAHGNWEGCGDPRSCTIPAQEHRDDPVEHLKPGVRTRVLKSARQAARSVLPNATETRIVVTGNYRAWRHFIDLRASEHADVEIREVAIAILGELAKIAPNVFGDYEYGTAADGTTTARSQYAERS